MSDDCLPLQYSFVNCTLWHVLNVSLQLCAEGSAVLLNASHVCLGYMCAQIHVYTQVCGRILLCAHVRTVAAARSAGATCRPHEAQLRGSTGVGCKHKLRLRVAHDA